MRERERARARVSGHVHVVRGLGFMVQGLGFHLFARCTWFVSGWARHAQVKVCSCVVNGVGG